LKQNSITDRTAPISNKIPIANPAFPAVLIPPELELVVALDVALAADIVEDLVGVLEDEMLVSAKSGWVGVTDVLGGVMAVGIPLELEVVLPTRRPVFVAPSSGGDGVEVVATTGPNVEYPPTAPVKVFEAVTYTIDTMVDACCTWSCPPKTLAIALAALSKGLSS
jgi:hypothetical protein